ncbi:MAG: CbiX/SirB N-terminal domain-containing protein [Burkholderiaceae bacterium]
MKRGLILYAHGARDARWAEPFESLKTRVAELLPHVIVMLAYLELMQPGLQSACAVLSEAGCDSVLVVPVFLGQGAHVREDLPAQIASAREAFPGLVIQAGPVAGESAAVIDALAHYCLDQFRSVNP